MLRPVNWSKLCQSQHIWGMFVSLISSNAFVNWQIILINRFKWLELVGFNVLTALTVYCIVRTIRLDPGRVPLIWDFQRARVKKYCLLCHNFKPDRSHHCSTCGRCVLNMDHHCPWLGNCIGFYNRKIFMLAVIYGWSTIATGIGICVPKVIAYKQLQLIDLATFLIPFAFLCFMFVLVSIFLHFHVSLIYNNLTTIEHLERKRALFPESQTVTYDKGCSSNTEQVFGQNSGSWCFPSEPDNLPVDGIIWSIKDGPPVQWNEISHHHDSTDMNIVRQPQSVSVLNMSQQQTNRILGSGKRYQ